MKINLNQITLAIALTVMSALPARAFPVTQVTFANDTYCGSSENTKTWHSIKVKADQTITILINDEHNTGSNTVVIPNKKEIDLQAARIDSPVYNIVAYRFTVRESGNYQFRSYTDEGYDTAHPIVVCVKSPGFTKLNTHSRQLATFPLPFWRSTKHNRKQARVDLKPCTASITSPAINTNCKNSR